MVHGVTGHHGLLAVKTVKVGCALELDFATSQDHNLEDCPALETVLMNSSATLIFAMQLVSYKFHLCIVFMNKLPTMANYCFVLSLSSVRRNSRSVNDTIFQALVSLIPIMYKLGQMRAHRPGPGEELF